MDSHSKLVFFPPFRSKHADMGTKCFVIVYGEMTRSDQRKSEREPGSMPHAACLQLSDVLEVGFFEQCKLNVCDFGGKMDQIRRQRADRASDKLKPCGGLVERSPLKTLVVCSAVFDACTTLHSFKQACIHTHTHVMHMLVDFKLCPRLHFSSVHRDYLLMFLHHCERSTHTTFRLFSKRIIYVAFVWYGLTTAVVWTQTCEVMRAVHGFSGHICFRSQIRKLPKSLSI